MQKGGGRTEATTITAMIAFALVAIVLLVVIIPWEGLLSTELAA